ncbi:STAS domain-containing protein [Spirulina subsalsa FACHB-351]|uniref:STAS domain-containing protein n=1 Tax=Spirulina subsalsa FACHB-351 TaxID=234711 RepID=A0ABT3L728_9CYAN|nr:STAS domain-containing protein [Spirulina subsalsa]MCW6037313.1 STAS domain-containing protein [Spirulina subsalsa FACHB-351]
MIKQMLPDDSKLTVVQLKGSLNSNHAFEVQRHLLDHTLVGSNTSILLLDFSELQSLDRDGLMVLVSIVKFARGLGQRLVCCSVSASIRMIFELTQLDRVLETYETGSEFLLKNA